MEIHRGYQKKKTFFRRKSAISLVRWNFHLLEKSFWRYSCRICMHKLEKYIEILWDHQKKLRDMCDP